MAYSMTDLGYIFPKYGLDAVKKASGWQDFGGGWKINHTSGMLASPDMDVVANPNIGVSIDQYNELYKDRRKLDPYKYSDTGWIWNSDKGAYYWPRQLKEPGSADESPTSYFRHLRPGETNSRSGFWGSIAPAVSFFTGGLSDLAQGHKLGEGLLGDKGASLFQDFVLSTGTAGLSDAYKGYEKYQDTGDIWAGADRLVDPGGVVDAATRKVGSWLPYSIRKQAPALGSAIGSIIYPVAGTAAGYGVGAKIKGGEDVYDYKGDMIGAGTAAALAYLGQGAGQYFGGASSTPSGMNPYNSYIMGGNNAAAGNLAYGNASNLGTFTGSTGNYFAAAPELGLMSSSMAPLSSYTAGGGSLPTVTGDSLKTYTGNTTGEYFTPKTDFSPTITDKLLDEAKKIGGKQLGKAIIKSLLPESISALPAAATYGLLSSYASPSFQTTGNNWAVPEPLEEAATVKALTQPTVNNIIKEEEEEELQPWLKYWMTPYNEYAANIEPTTTDINNFLKYIA